jgi:citrate synthase
MTELISPEPGAGALDVLFILHADHGRTAARPPCGRSATRTSTPTRRWQRGCCALRPTLPAGRTSSPANAGRNQVVSKVPEFITRVKSGDGGVRLMGFGRLQV